MLYEKIINQILALDPQVNAILKPLENSLLRLHLSPWGRWDVCWIKDYLHIQPTQEDQHPSVEMWLSSRDLIRLGLKQIGPRTGMPSGVKVQGDIALLRLWEHNLKRLQLDWELELSKYIGEPAAFAVGRLFRHIQSWLQHLAKTLPEQTALYLKEEAGYLPPTVLAHEHRQEVERLRDDVARLVFRIERLQEVLKKL